MSDESVVCPRAHEGDGAAGTPASLILEPLHMASASSVSWWAVARLSEKNADGNTRTYLSAESDVAASRWICSTSAFSCFFWTFSALRISRSIFAPMSEAPTTTSPA